MSQLLDSGEESDSHAGPAAEARRHHRRASARAPWQPYEKWNGRGQVRCIKCVISTITVSRDTMMTDSHSVYDDDDYDDDDDDDDDNDDD